MSRYKASGRLLGIAVDDDDDDEEISDEGEEAEMDEEEDEDSEDEDEGEEAKAEAGTSKDGGSEDVPELSREEKNKRKQQERQWDAAHFVERVKTSSGKVVYKTTLLEDLTFFSREEIMAFVKGKRYKELLHKMKVGMRTHNDNEKLKLKAEARRSRLQAKLEIKKKEKRKNMRTGSNDEDIEKKKAAFQAKKARRLARKAEAAAST